MMNLTGKMLIGGQGVAGRRDMIRALDPSTDQPLEPGYAGADREQVEQACALAWEAFDAYRETAPETRARLLETIADEMEALGDGLIERAMVETSLPRARLQGERGRTCGQLRLFARTLRANSRSWPQ
ncbi:aldehyde dehydrogenase family protein, partial [Chromobacterium piscinae]|uniref:aldehyde dehydrogenase family protein n=1 Tax=Chromobacterium piscinae TaxID=686831 RepID=UPI0032605316